MVFVVDYGDDDAVGGFIIDDVEDVIMKEYDVAIFELAAGRIGLFEDGVRVDITATQHNIAVIADDVVLVKLSFDEDEVAGYESLCFFRSHNENRCLG